MGRMFTKVESLRKVRTNLTSILVSDETTSERLGIASFASSRYQIEWTARAEALLQKSKRQNQEELYRFCPGVTAFCIPDSDLHATECEDIFGIRIDVLLGGKALNSYITDILVITCALGKATESYFLYFKLNKPAGSILNLYEHTLPDFLPLEDLTTTYMPMSVQEPYSHKENLQSFVRELRHLLMSFHLRKAAVEKMQEQLERSEEFHDLEDSPTLLSICAANPEVTEIDLSWSKDIVGRLHLSQDGVLNACVIHGKSGRIRRAEHSLLRGDRHVSQVLSKVKAIQVV